MVRLALHQGMGWGGWVQQVEQVCGKERGEEKRKKRKRGRKVGGEERNGGEGKGRRVCTTSSGKDH